MTLPKPPEDEPWQVWHRAASEQLANAVTMGPGGDASAALYRANDFANRALEKAMPMETIVTSALKQAVNDVRFAMEHPEILKEVTDAVIRRRD